MLVDVDVEALEQLGVSLGDKVMVCERGGAEMPGEVVLEGRLAIRAAWYVEHERVRVRRRGAHAP
jgi:hypothetical protein